MSILQALSSYYDRLAERGGAPEFGFSIEKISFVIVLSPEGEVAGIQSVQDTSGSDPQPSRIEVPKSVKRSVNIEPNLLWDKSAYVLGIAKEDESKLEEKHKAFREKHLSLLREEEDEGLVALRKFVEHWEPARFQNLPFREEIRGENIVFRLDSEQRYLHERTAASKVIARHTANSETKSTQGLCLVTGKQSPIARLHPSIKGVRGAQSSGASIVSFNEDAFTSYGKEQGSNAPISEHAAFTYTTALNQLLSRDDRRITIGDTTTIFWAEARHVGEAAAGACEEFFANIASPPSEEEASAEIRDALKRIATGQPAENHQEILPDTPFHILGLAPNTSRLSIRFWSQNTIGGFAKQIEKHWQDLEIEPPPRHSPPPIWHLLNACGTAREKRDSSVNFDTKSIPPLLSGALTKAILTGERYPQTLFSTIIMRIRADHHLNTVRISILKAGLARDHRLGFEKEGIPVSIDTSETNPGYRLGRLFAVMEGAQRKALGKVNATIRDRYFGAASATPASTFPALIRNTQHHLKAIRTRHGEGFAVLYEKKLGQIFGGFPVTEFPRSLSMADQGRFAIGYYHEREDLYRRKDEQDPVNTSEEGN